jgi:hypothetical protein
MIEIEKFDATDKRELLSRERYWIELMKPSMNKTIPGRTGAEWLQDNAEYMKRYHKQYRLDNAEHMKQHMKQYYREHAEQIKQYHRDNAEHIKQYRLDNAEHIKQRGNKKHTCGCGGRHTYANKAKHLKTKKHREYETRAQI